jgi:hypothetical protein
LGYLADVLRAGDDVKMAMRASAMDTQVKEVGTWYLEVLALMCNKHLERAGI